MSDQPAAPEVDSTAPAAPAATNPPAAPATPEPTKAASPDESIEYESTGDPGLDYALGFIAKAGIDAEHPALVAASEGDFGLLEALLAEKGIAGWEQAIALGKRAHQSILAKQEETVKQVQEAVSQVAEGLGIDWEQAVTYARENATEEEVTKINELFKDPVTAKIAALYVSYSYANSPGVNVPARKSAVKENAAPAAAAPAGGPLTRAEFAAEAGKLYRKFGDGASQRPEYAALAARLQR